MPFAIAFLVVASLMCVAIVVAVFAAADAYYLTGSRAIEDDGITRGAQAPAWCLPDSAGAMACSPPRAAPLQLIMFTDHSLKSFPSLIEGLHGFVESEPELEIVILMRGPRDLAAPLLRLLGLGQIPVITGSSALYGSYNVRVIPFAIIVDSAGQVRASSLVNHAWQLEMLIRLAAVAPSPEELATERRLSRRKEAVSDGR